MSLACRWSPYERLSKRGNDFDLGAALYSENRLLHCGIVSEQLRDVEPQDLCDSGLLPGKTHGRHDFVGTLKRQRHDGRLGTGR